MANLHTSKYYAFVQVKISFNVRQINGTQALLVFIDKNKNRRVDTRRNRLLQIEQQA